MNFRETNIDENNPFRSLAPVCGRLADSPSAIDLGLPSGTKWACCNVGASSHEEYGSYYAWGETDTKDDYANDNCLYDGQNIGTDIAATGPATPIAATIMQTPCSSIQHQTTPQPFMKAKTLLSKQTAMNPFRLGRIGQMM